MCVCVIIIKSHRLHPLSAQQVCFVIISLALRARSRGLSHEVRCSDHLKFEQAKNNHLSQGLIGPTTYASNNLQREQAVGKIRIILLVQSQWSPTGRLRSFHIFDSRTLQSTLKRMGKLFSRHLMSHPLSAQQLPFCYGIVGAEGSDIFLKPPNYSL